MEIIDQLNAAIATEKQQFADFKANTDTQLAAKDQTIAERDATILDLQNQLANSPTAEALAPVLSGITEIVP